MARRARAKKYPDTKAPVVLRTLGEVIQDPTLFLSLREVAAILRCQEATVRKMIAAKRLRAVRIGQGRSWRVPRSAVEALATARD